MASYKDNKVSIDCIIIVGLDSLSIELSVTLFIQPYIDITLIVLYQCMDSCFIFDLLLVLFNMVISLINISQCQNRLLVIMIVINIAFKKFIHNVHTHGSICKMDYYLLLYFLFFI